MSNVPAKVSTRITTGLKRFQPILASARARDVNESDTVVIVSDMLQEVFGYDKYNEITSEHMIRGTFCDLAIKFDGDIKLLIEVKAIGLDLKDSFVKQAVDYAVNQGCEWVALTNGIIWRAYHVIFAKPIDFELVVEINLCELNPKNSHHIDMVWLLSKEGWQKSRLGEYHTQRQALSRFTMAAVILSEPILEVIRRELRRISPGVRIELDEIVESLRNDVFKREILEGEKAELAKKQIAKAASRGLRAARTPKVSGEIGVSEVDTSPIDGAPDTSDD